MGEKKSRGGAVKKAPPGYYTAQQAMQQLGLNPSTFHYYVRTGKIPKHVPPLKTEGFYDKKEIDRMATEIALFFHTQEKETHIETRPAQRGDAQGIYDVYDKGMVDPQTGQWRRWGATPITLRLAWYQANPWIDFVVLLDGEVVGYISAVPYTKEAMQDILTRRRRGWHMEASDIRPYDFDTPSEYDLYIGIGVRQDRPNPRWLAFRLISGWITFLGELAAKGARIHYLYAVSAEEAGQNLCQALGFEELPTSEEDIFPDPKPWKKYRLDLTTSESPFARKYRESLKD